jgi:hypothetical protein
MCEYIQDTLQPSLPQETHVGSEMREQNTIPNIFKLPSFIIGLSGTQSALLNRRDSFANLNESEFGICFQDGVHVALAPCVVRFFHRPPPNQREGATALLLKLCQKEQVYIAVRAHYLTMFTVIMTVLAALVVCVFALMGCLWIASPQSERSRLESSKSARNALANDSEGLSDEG